MPRSRRPARSGRPGWIEPSSGPLPSPSRPAPPRPRAAELRDPPSVSSRSAGFRSRPVEVPGLAPFGEPVHAAVGAAPEDPAVAGLPGNEEDVRSLGEEGLRLAPGLLSFELVSRAPNLVGDLGSQRVAAA